MKIENKEFACVTNVEIVPINLASNDVTFGSKVEIKPNVQEKNSESAALSVVESSPKVPYILNGELYQILARNGENVTVKCCFCPAGRFYRGSVRSTGNFHMHIKRRHPYLLGRLHDMKVASLLERRDRLTKNRRTKLRRLAHKKITKVEIAQDVHKLKIRRAFQRHQAEAKGSLQIVPLSTENANNAKNLEDFSMKRERSTQLSESMPSNEILLAQNNTEVIMDGNVYYDIGMHNNVQTMTQEVPATTSQQTTPTPTPYPSTYDGSAFGEYSSPPPAVHHVEIESINAERPLDLSLNSAYASGEDSTAELSTYASSGIDLGPIFSDTTVANTVSTTISAVKSANEYHVAAGMLHNCDIGSNWQRLALTLRDIHNDMSTRNRIEHNRLLLDIAKFKFLHPGFYFNL